jgi:hypothetical protein
VAALRDYEAVFTKRELVGRTMYADQMLIKHRHQPFSVYLRFVGKNDGREVLYVENRNQGKLLAHESPSSLKSLVGTISLDPNSPRAMEEGRHPITEIGMQKMIEALIQQWEFETKLADCAVKFYPNAKLGDIECQVVESSHAQPRPEFKFKMTRLYIDKKTNFPIRVEQWGFPRPGSEPFVIEEYTYTSIKHDVGLADADFDVRNRSYKF